MTGAPQTVTEARRTLEGAVSERQFAQQVVDAAHALGWKVYRTYRSTRSPAGFPDLVMVRAGRLVFCELKTMTGRPSRAQREWLAALEHVEERTGAIVEQHLWRPSDWDEILEVLR